ncbi:MAG TPA: 50S ribosomal protein L25, partial [Firmicutes bacterium]|nr:50S ribosomal protein L25 [Bacillota bacterium]
KQIQRDYLGTDIIHLDFYRIYKDKDIHVSIPIVAVNRAKGEIEGGVLDQSMFSVEVSGLPVNVPPVLEVDVSNLEIGDNYTIGDLETPEGVKLLDSPDRVVFTVVPPKGMEIEEEVVAEEVEEEEAPAEGEEEGEKVEPSEESTT